MAADHPVAVNLEDVTPATRLLEKKREVEEVQQELDAQKLLYQKKEEHFRRREENLRKKDLELQEALVLFNKFLKENEARRDRDEKRAKSERKAREKKEREIQMRREELRQNLVKRDSTRRKLARLRKYKQFLETMHEENIGEYPDSNLDRIISRHKTLNDANADLVAHQQEVTQEMEELRQAYVSRRKELQNEQLAFNNDIARCQKQLEQAKSRGLAFEERSDMLRRDEQTRTLKLSQILQAVYNLNLVCTKYFVRLGLPSRGLNHTISVAKADKDGTGKKKKKRKSKSAYGGDGADGSREGGDGSDGGDAGSSDQDDEKQEGPDAQGAGKRGWKRTLHDAEQKLDVLSKYFVDFEDIINPRDD